MKTIRTYNLISIAVATVISMILSCAPKGPNPSLTAPQVTVTPGANKITSVAVMDFEFKPEDWFPQSEISALVRNSERSIDNGGEILTEQFIAELMSLGKYEIVERTRLKAIIEEQSLSASGLTEGNLTTIGELLDINGFIYGKVNYFTEQTTAMVSKKIKVSVTVKCVNINTGRIMWTVSDEFVSTGVTPVSASRAICKRMVAGLAGKLP